MAIKTIEQRKKEYDKSRWGELVDQTKVSNKSFDAQSKTVKDNYKLSVDEVEDDYQSLYDENSVQKLINEREVAENMANLGLTDSGLNRTQQTAVELSAANNKAKFDRDKQKTIDGMASELAATLSEISINKQNAKQSIRANWENENWSLAQNDYNTEVEAQTARYKASSGSGGSSSDGSDNQINIISNNNFNLNGNFEGTLKSNGVSVRYYTDDNGYEKTIYMDENTGKSTTVNRTVNPYTGDDNAKIIEEFGAYENGYQPKGKKGVGKFVGVDGTDIKYGNRQNIFKTADGRLWIWDRNLNDYQEVV